MSDSGTRAVSVAGRSGVSQGGPVDHQVERLIEALDLAPLPGEGGWFRRTWTAPEDAGADLPARYGRSARPFGSAIYYLLADRHDGFSAFHRLPGDEVYHFYLGDPVSLVELMPDGGGRTTFLGPDILGGQHVQHTVAAGVWQGSRPAVAGGWSLLGTTMAPGFDPRDFELARRERLLETHPTFREEIRALTRETAS